MANRALEAMFGWAPGGLIGQSIERLVSSMDRGRHRQHRLEYFAAPRPRPMGRGLFLIGERQDGSTFPIEVSLNHVPTASGGRAIAFVTDITERQQAESALQERTAELEYRTTQLSQMAWDLTLAEHNAREQIARTLHDGLQQLLFIVSLNLDQQLNRDREVGAEPSALLSEAKHHLDEATAAARSLHLELFPPSGARDCRRPSPGWRAGHERNPSPNVLSKRIRPPTPRARMFARCSSSGQNFCSTRSNTRRLITSLCRCGLGATINCGSP
jgi:PAS domain S-box-containing protein